MPKIVTKKEKQERLRRNEEKWTPALMDAGWTVIPSIILERQQALGCKHSASVSTVLVV